MDAGDEGSGGAGSVHYGQTRGKLLIRTSLPLPPTTNNLYGHRVVSSKEKDEAAERTLYAIRYPTTENREYHKLVADTLLELRALHHSMNRLAYRLLVCPARHGSDISNRIKILEDALKDGGLFVDDEQVDEVWVRRGPIVRPDGIVRISLWEVIPDYNANLRWVEG
jgi:Holliday junction resolvase RusA-like endonuclease